MGLVFAAVIVECVFFIYLVTIGWAFRSLMLSPGDPEIAVRTRTVIANAVWLGLNLSAFAAYALRRQGLPRNWVAAVLGFDVLNALIAAVGWFMQSDSRDGLAWLAEGLVPAAAIFILLKRGDLDRISS